jgi:hypothetical protein
MVVWGDSDGFLSRAPVARAVVVNLWRRRDGFFAPPYRRLAKRSSGMAFSGVSPILLVSLTTCIDPYRRAAIDCHWTLDLTLDLGIVARVRIYFPCGLETPTQDETQDQKESFSRQ